MGNTSPGRVSFVFRVTDENGEPYTPPGGGIPASVAAPSPTNNDPVKLVLTGLESDKSYRLSLWTRSQSGLLSVHATEYFWRILATAPSVAVELRPDSMSGTARPLFRFSADWQGRDLTSTLNDTGRDIVFEMLLLSDADLGSYHTPPVCDASQANKASQRDCVDPGCSYLGCNYSVSLIQARGTLQAYTLQVRTHLYSSTGVDSTLLWSYHRCATSEYAVFTGLDTVTCMPCPVGGDCTGEQLANSTVPLAGVPESDAGVVVREESIAAMPGFWASPSSDGLQFYACPLAAACLPGVNGTRSLCAQGYGGVLCSVCSPGYFNQYGLCVECT